MTRTLVGMLLFVVTSAIATAQEPDIEYARDVRPILAANCFRCHGPDAESRAAELRLDQREAALRPAESGRRAIVPGQPDASELIRRIEAHDTDELMPPPSSKKSLTKSQRDILRRWIKAGAAYQQHWSFVAPKKVSIPTIKMPHWARNDIDRFVLARLEANGLQPSSEARPEALLRRVSLDLIGLPPTSQEVDEFLAACRTQSPTTSKEVGTPTADHFEQQRIDAAYEAAVNRLLQSPQYGERWARRWLDLARYADTNGYEKDRMRTIWPYRDWVIKALNADLPFDRFTIEQLAGDMLPNATSDQRIATGFHRNTMLNEEGGIDPLEFRFHAMTDRVATTGTTWLGLTLGCAQCHTHKYDPVTHREYYQFMAFLNNADEPDFDLPDEQREATHQRQLQEADKLQSNLAKQWPITDVKGAIDEDRRASALQVAFTAWVKEQRARNATWTTIRPKHATSNLPLLTLQVDDSIMASGDTTKSDLYELTFESLPAGVTALRLEALPDERLPAHGPGLTYYEGTKGDFFLTEFLLRADGQPIKIRAAQETYSKNRFGANPVKAQMAIDGDMQTGWAVDGRQGERHVAVFMLDQPLPSHKVLTLHMHFGRHFASSLGRFRLSITTAAHEPIASELSDATIALLQKDAGLWTEPERSMLETAFLLQAPELKASTDRIKQLRKRPGATATLVMQERPPENPRSTHVHHRGEYLQTKDKIDAAVPAFLPALPSGVFANRLNFARWLVSKDNPLTARVAVNRQWAAFFGRGIVPTLQDFGVQGDLPSHPELLDWLALRFMDDGWSMKRLHQRIVLSATYRQQSAMPTSTIDPDNKLLGRAPRIRLEAEVLRDSVLRASGLLSSKLGGPSVFPPQPASITTEGTYGAMTWTASTGEDRYRRSLYTFSKRTAPFAMLTTFDAPSGEACMARRDVSNTPLQALTLLNDVMFTEASQALGKRLAALPGSNDDKITELWKRTLSRMPTPAERVSAANYLEAQAKRLQAKELDAVKLVGSDAPNVIEQALWTLLSRALLNVDEMQTRG